MTKTINKFRELDKKRTQGKWEFVKPLFLGKYTELVNDEFEPVLQATGMNDGDEGLQWFDEELGEADKELIESIPEMLSLIKELEAAIKAIMLSCDKTNPSHETIWRIAYDAVKDD